MYINMALPQLLKVIMSKPGVKEFSPILPNVGKKAKIFFFKKGRKLQKDYLPGIIMQSQHTFWDRTSTSTVYHDHPGGRTREVGWEIEQFLPSVINL